MKVMVVDDDARAIRHFELATEPVRSLTLAGTFCNGRDALKFAQNNEIDAALLDIELPDISGLEIAEELQEMHPGMVIVFVSSHEKYIIDTLHVKGDYFLQKPYTNDQLMDVLERMRLLCGRRKKRIRARMFGRFDLFIDDKIVLFTNRKAKELLALCLDRHGGTVSMEEAIDKLWESRIYDAKVKNLYRKAVMYLRQMFQKNDCNDVFISVRGACSLDCSKITCDYFDFLYGRDEGIRQWEITGTYLFDYTWAEERNADIENLYREKYQK